MNNPQHPNCRCVFIRITAADLTLEAEFRTSTGDTMPDYTFPETPQDPALRERHSAVGELLGVISRRMLGADRTEADRIISLLQVAAMGQRDEDPSNRYGIGAHITLPDGAVAVIIGEASPPELPPELLTDDPGKSLAFQALEDHFLNGNREPGDEPPIGFLESLVRCSLTDCRRRSPADGERCDLTDCQIRVVVEKAKEKGRSDV